MSQIVCLRHGEYDRATGGHLNDLGKTQAQESSEKLRQLITANSGVRIYSSPLPRVLETAEIIAGAIGCEVETAEHLDEYPNVERAKFWRQIVAPSSDLIILVTHFWTVKDGLQEIGKLLHKSWSQYRDPKPVEGWVLDVETASVEDFVR